MQAGKNNLLGVAALVLSISIFSLQDILVKWMGSGYPVLQIVIFRSLTALPATLIFFRLEGRKGLPTTKHYRLEILRGALFFLSYTTYFMGLAALPLAEIAAIRFSTPLMITLLSVLLLKEKVSLRRWIALVVGFAGVLMIIQPGSAGFNAGSFFVMLNVLFYVLAVMVTRRLQASDSSATMSFYSSLVYVVIAVALAPVVASVGEIPNASPSVAFLFHPWRIPGLEDTIVMGGLGLIWAGGMYFQARAYSLALASVAAPFEYVTLPINTLWGLLLWHQFPSLPTWLGAGLTLLCGLYSFYQGQRERLAQSVTVR